MVVTLFDLVRAARAHRAPLAGESAGYLILALTEQVSDAPRTVRSTEVELAEDGAVRVARGQASSEAAAEVSLRGVLDALLQVASSPSAALVRASRRPEAAGLSSLIRELEAALIPVNRAAARRALARLHRETCRAVASGVLPAHEAPVAHPPTETASPLLALEPDVDDPYIDLPVEVCTRPEPILLRHARRPDWDQRAAPEVPRRTPTLGTRVSELPVLDSADRVDQAALDGAVHAPPMDECTESMPDVAPLLPNVAIVESRKSDLGELLDSFQIAADDPSHSLGRAIKEMAELDLTPAWSKS